MKIIESRENLSAPSFPRLNLNFPLVSLVFPQKLFQSARGHEFGDKYKPWWTSLTRFLIKSSSVISPIFMKFDNVRVINQSQGFKHILKLGLFFALELFLVGKYSLVPNYFHSFFCIHGKVSSINTRNISVFNLFFTFNITIAGRLFDHILIIVVVVAVRSIFWVCFSRGSSGGRGSRRWCDRRCCGDRGWSGRSTCTRYVFRCLI